MWSQYLENHSGGSPDKLVRILLDKIEAVITGIENPQPVDNSRKGKPFRFKDFCPDFNKD